MPRKKKDRVYFTIDTEKAIIEYNKTTDIKIRNKIYEESIKYPFLYVLFVLFLLNCEVF